MDPGVIFRCRGKNSLWGILVIQDDIFIINNFKILLNKCMQQITPNWKLLFLGGNDPYIKNKHTIINNFYIPNGTCDGAFSVGIDESIYHELINEIDKFNMPFDSGPLKNIQKKYTQNCVVFYPNLMIADLTESDCRLSRDQVKYGNKLSWNIEKYNISKITDCIFLTIILYDFYNNFTCDVIDTIIHNYKKLLSKVYIIILSENINQSYIYKNIRIYNVLDIRNRTFNIHWGLSISYTNYIYIDVLTEIINNHLIDIFYQYKYTYYLYIPKDIYNIYGSIINKYEYLKYDTFDYFLNKCNENNNIYKYIL